MRFLADTSVDQAIAIAAGSIESTASGVVGHPADAIHIATTVGLLLGASLLAGVASEMLRLPKVTAYLVAGMLLGQSAFDIVPHDHYRFLEPLTKLAMALVLFYLGTLFPFDQIRRIARRAIPLSIGELVLTGLLVTVGTYFCGMTLAQAVLLGTLALATAPATTMFVLRETNAEGPVTSLTGTLVTLNNLVAVVAFELVWLGIELANASGANAIDASSIASTLLRLVQSLGGAFTLGLVGGLVMSYACEVLHTRRWLVLLVAMTALLLGLSEQWQLPYMLVFLVVGFVVVNSSSGTAKITARFDSIGGLLTVMFFSVHGSELNLALLWDVGLVGAAYVILRSLGKVIGVWAVASRTEASPEIRNWLGPGLLAQAGVAISLSATATSRNPEIVGNVQTIILGTVVVFEIFGPLLTRAAVLRSGEMPIANSIHHTFGTPLSALRNVVTRLAGSAGLLDKKTALSERMRVEQVMRRTVQGIAENADFNEVVHFVEHSHDNTFPVVDSDRCIVGLIRFDLLNQAFFDPQSDHLICAGDLATPPEILLRPSQPVRDAVALFRHTSDDCVPVVTDESPHRLIATVRRSDLTSLLIRDRKAGLGGSEPMPADSPSLAGAASGGTN
ncbi:Kef-type K+ transport system, membrane component KefB [Neorhodopirellula lusitana]|uniref:Kef-type K+ transport system, membrane component KefB n=1 Tax=Neorhodopirellula lusitana TaxID=445327 RepID=A0ABY1PQN2_9BACT|nr:cation:proton antiporter [Neorhodopirellula lusitana]SMP38098.1 Kef-type K+ transport system, membrane component KefB [Neorhodopirellula lusitana]